MGLVVVLADVKALVFMAGAEPVLTCACGNQRAGW
jgi:hypothetical protein